MELLHENDFLLSNSARGYPYHNAIVERFMKALKQEEVYLMNYETYLDVLENLPRFVEEVYCGRKVGEREPIRVGARSGVQLMDRWR